MLKIENFEKFGTGGGRKSLKIRLIFLKSLNMGTISPRKHEMAILESFGKDRANPEDPSNKFLKILNMGPISSRKREIEIW